MTLQFIDIVNGTFSIICVIVSFIIGFTVISKFRECKQKKMIYIGYTIIGNYSTWWPSSISFIIALFNGDGLFYYQSLYFLILGFLIAPIIIFWTIAMLDLLEVKEKNKKRITALITFESIIFQILYLFFTFVQPTQIGYLTSPVDVTLGGFGKVFAINILTIYVILLVFFSIKSMRLEGAEIKWKRRFLILGCLFFFIAALFDSSIPLDIMGLTIIRIILIISITFFYFGFILPDPLKKRLIK